MCTTHFALFVNRVAIPPILMFLSFANQSRLLSYGKVSETNKLAAHNLQPHIKCPLCLNCLLIGYFLKLDDPTQSDQCVNDSFDCYYDVFKTVKC